MESSVSLNVMLLALYFSGTDCNSILAVVGFACANCSPKSSLCCTGTFILPTFVLTSKTCAETCHAIDFGGKEIPLTETYVHVHHGPRFKGITGVDGAAIARIASVMHNEYVKLSPLEAFSAIGFKVLIPRYSNNEMTLKPAVITLCEKSSIYTDGYYICTAINENDRCRIKQGSPLFFNGKVIGILGVRSIKNCNYLQTAFIAIAPFISWIQKVVNYESSIGVQETTGSTVYFNITEDKTDPDVITETTLKEKMVLSLNPTEADIKIIRTNNNFPIDKTIFPHARNILRVKPAKTTNKKHNIDSNKKSLITKRKPIKRKNTKFNPNTRSFKRPITIKITAASTSMKKKIKLKQATANASKINTITTISSSKSATSTLNTELNFTATTKSVITQPTKIKPAEKEVSTALTDAVMSSTLESPTIYSNTELSIGTKVTNAMDWFNNNIRSKLKDNPSVFVLTTEPLFEAYTTEFVDLT